MKCPIAIIRRLDYAPAALSVLASAVLLAQPACGQEATNAPALPAAAYQSSDAIGLRPATLFTGYRLGPVDVQPRCKAGVTYDDNILLSASSAHPESDVIWSVQPGFLAVAGDRSAMQDYLLTYDNILSFSPDTFIITEPETWPGRTAMLDYAPKFNHFTDHSENDSIDQFLTFDGLWPVGRMILGAQQQYVRQNTTIIEAGRRTWQENIPTVLMGGYQISEKTTAEVNLTRNSVSYEENQGLADYTDWHWDNWLNYQYSPNLNLALGASVGLTELPSQPDQTYETPMARARYRYGERLIVGGSAGLQLRQYDGGVAETAEPVFNLTGYYQVSDNATCYLEVFRRDLPSVTYGYDYISTGLSVGLRHRLRDRYITSLEFTYYNSAYSATSSTLVSTEQAHRTDSFIEVRPAFDIRFSHHFFGSLFYLFRTVQSGQWDGWTDNQVGTQLTWTF